MLKQLKQDAAAPYLARLAHMRARFDGLDGRALIEAALAEFGDRLALTSSFGSEAVVELHMISQINPSMPVIFLNTGKMFGETLRYRDLLQTRLGLTDIRSISPDPADRARLDPQGTLWSRDPDLCCHFRKTLPQERALEGFEAIITGRKRFQTAARQHIGAVDLVERPQGFSGFRFTINPLAHWTLEEINAYIDRHDLPRHPLVAAGYLSIGCMPCTARAEAGAYRSGRWAGQEKEECGIHQPSFIGGDGI